MLTRRHVGLGPPMTGCVGFPQTRHGSKERQTPLRTRPHVGYVGFGPLGDFFMRAPVYAPTEQTLQTLHTRHAPRIFSRDFGHDGLCRVGPPSSNPTRNSRGFRLPFQCERNCGGWARAPTDRSPPTVRSPHPSSIAARLAQPQPSARLPFRAPPPPCSSRPEGAPLQAAMPAGGPGAVRGDAVAPCRGRSRWGRGRLPPMPTVAEPPAAPVPVPVVEVRPCPRPPETYLEWEREHAWKRDGPEAGAAAGAGGGGWMARPREARSSCCWRRCGGVWGGGGQPCPRSSGLGLALASTPNGHGPRKGLHQWQVR